MSDLAQPSSLYGNVSARLYTVSCITILMLLICLASAQTTGRAASTTAATVTVSGRVTNEQGRGIGRMTVYLQDLVIGTVQVTQTRGDGSYIFTDVPIYNHYSVMPQHRLYKFAPGIQSFSLVEEMRNVNFTATRR